MTVMQKARENMIEGQIRPNKVTHEGVLDAMRRIPREAFVPQSAQALAYADADVPLGNGRAMLSPMVLARLLQEADIQPSDVVLDIGCGAGYAAALMSTMAETVIATEPDETLARSAEEAMRALDCLNVAVMSCDLAGGCEKHAPYDVILINGGVEQIPAAILAQLADGGRLVTVRMNPGDKLGTGQGQAVVVQRYGEVVGERPLFDAAAVRLDGFRKPESFVF